ncbi:MAG: hypothetical protein ACOYOZ_15200, partial [Pirellula sp.]
PTPTYLAPPSTAWQRMATIQSLATCRQTVEAYLATPKPPLLTHYKIKKNNPRTSSINKKHSFFLRKSLRDATKMLAFGFLVT